MKSRYRPEVALFIELWILSLFLVSVDLCRSQGTGASTSYIAKAGDVFISEKEFVQRFEMLPALYRHRKRQLEGAKLELLYSIIAEKLLAQEAIARRLDQDTVVHEAFDEVRSLLARDELYREEVGNKVSLPVSEIRKGIADAQTQLLIEFLYFDHEQDAKFVRGRIEGPKDFDRIRVDTSMDALRDTATVIWGDADPAIQEAAYKLRQDQVSPVVAAGGGFYILKRIKAQTNGFYASMQPDVLEQRVTARIRIGKERLRAAQFVEEILKGKVGHAIAKRFRLLGETIAAVFKTNESDSTIWFDSNIASRVKSMLGSSVSDTIVVVGEDRWTIEDVVDRLVARKFSIARSEILALPSRLNGQIRLMVQQELLGQEAVRRGLDRIPQVREQLEMWQSAYLADLMREYVRRQVKLSNTEVFSYLKSKDPKVNVPLVDIRELLTNSITEMHEALSDMEDGQTLQQVIDKWSSDPGLRKNRGITGFFPVTDRRPIGEIASEMEVGQQYGPVKTSDGFVYFELLGRKDEGTAIDTAGDARWRSARDELLRMKQKGILDTFLAQVGQERGFVVYEDRLKKISVSSVPMMTFRMLGFGGRMVAVPFVQKELNWLDINPPAQKILP